MREFWIDPYEGIANAKPAINGALQIHVVEYSAYDENRKWFKAAERRVWELENELNRHKELLRKAVNRCADLQTALEHYADPFNWRTNSGKIGITFLTDGRDAEIINDQWTNGKLARETIKRLKEEAAE